MMSPATISPYFEGKKFRVDENDESIWLERLDEFGEPTEDYIAVDDELFQLLVENNQIEVNLNERERRILPRNIHERSSL